MTPNSTPRRTLTRVIPLERFARRIASGVAILSISALLGCGDSHPAKPISATEAPDDVSGEVVVTLASGVTPSMVLESGAGGTVVEWESEERFATLRPPAGVSVASYVFKLLSDQRVITAEANERLEDAESRQQSFAFDDGFGTPGQYLEQSASRALGLDAAHTVSTGAGVKVAILDTGVDPTHPALAGHIVDGADFIQDDAIPTDEINGLDDDGDGRVDEAYGHGTHTAGLVALAAPQAQLLIVRVLDADGRGTINDVASGIRWAVLHGARVINLSLGMLRNSDAIQDALDDAEAAGILVVASAGNWGSDQPREFPASSSHACAIAACDSASHPTSFTSFGSDIDLTAPGLALRSAFPGGLYRLWSGTSMSAPLVSGVAALLFAQHPTWDDQNVLDQMRAHARPIVGANSAQSGKLGAGMVHAGDSVRLPPPTSRTRMGRD